MGEFATRKCDGERVKIGTCDALYYIRYEDRKKVDYDFAGHDWFWRLPFPDEDGVGIGEYGDFNRGLRLNNGTDDYWDDDMADHPGRFQLRHKSGLQVSVPCYHGMRLPNLGDDARASWNGKSHSIELEHVKNTLDGLVPIIRCRHCGQAWRASWDEVLPFVLNPQLRERLEAYATEPQKVSG